MCVCGWCWVLFYDCFFVSHLFLPPQLHFLKPWPPVEDYNFTASHIDTFLLEDLPDVPLSNPGGYPLVYSLLLSSVVTLNIFLGSPCPLPTDGIRIETFFSLLPAVMTCLLLLYAHRLLELNFNSELFFFF